LCSYDVAMYYKKVLKPKNAIKKSYNVSSNTTNVVLMSVPVSVYWYLWLIAV
jgi:hypothetical protein